MDPNQGRFGSEYIGRSRTGDAIFGPPLLQSMYVNDLWALGAVVKQTTASHCISLKGITKEVSIAGRCKHRGWVRILRFHKLV